MHKVSSVRSSDGTTNLHTQTWIPAHVRATIVLVHGYAEHSGRYAHVGAELAAQGYAVYAYDQRGHGRSGQGLYIDAWEDFWRDLDVVLRRVREHHGKPVFLYGHSMGACIAASYVIDRRPALAGLILSSGLLKIPDHVSKLLVKIAAVLGRYLPRLQTIPVESSGLSRDPAVVAAYQNDSLVYHGRLPARIGAEMNRAVAMIQAQAQVIDVPLLLWHGTADTLTDPEGSRQVYTRASSPDKTLKLYPGGFHEMHNEPNQGEVFADFVAWLRARDGAGVS